MSVLERLAWLCSRPALVIVAVGCSPAPPPGAEPWTADELSVLGDMLVPAGPPAPSPSNAYADIEAAAELGHALFFDTGLSGDGSTSCASCHKPSLHFTDGQPTAVGAGQVGRHTPTVVGAAWFPFVTWDGRKDSLWSQALGPLEGAEEMATHRLLVHRRVFEVHRETYERVFGPLPRPPGGLEGLTVSGAAAEWDSLDEDDRELVTRVFVNVGKAFEAYQRRIAPMPSAFDAYVAALGAGDPAGGHHLSRPAVRGLRAFLGEAGCIHCHNGPLFTDLTFHNLGLPPGGRPADEGRAAGVTALLEDEFRSDGPYSDGGANPDLAYVKSDFEDALGAFKTPSLRNVARTPPYGHAGQFRSLGELLDFYGERRSDAEIGHVDPLLGFVGTDFDRDDMVAFLESLSYELPDSRWWGPPDQLQGRGSPEDR